MPTSITWDLFESTYLKPQISDVYGNQYDDEILKKTTYSTIADLVSKGLVDIGPLPSTTTLPATTQITYFNPNQVTVNNRFSITYKNETISFVATSSTISNVTANLTSLINSNSIFNTDLIAYDDSTRVRVEGITAGEKLEFFSVAERGTGTGNPVLEVIINTPAQSSKLVVNDLTSLTANHADAFNTIAAGVKYFLISDPVTKLQTAAGLDITKDKTLIAAAKANYDTLILAYLRIRILQEISAEDFWKERLAISSTQTEGTSSSGQLTLAERISLIQAESNAKLAEIAREEEKEINLQDYKRINAIELKQLERKHKLQDKEALREKNAINGAWTSSGQFTYSYVLDYETEITDTIPTVSRDLNNVDFGIPTLIQNQTYIGNSITNNNYRELSIEITASANITYTFKQLVGINYETVGSPVTDNVINKRYSLVNTTAYRIEITGTEPNTEVYIDAEVLA